VASPRHNLGRKPRYNPHGILPHWASSSRPPGRGQGADCFAFASGCTNSILPDCPRDDVRPDKWTRTGRRCGCPAHPEQGAGGVLRRGPGAVPHRVRTCPMAGAVAAVAWRRASCPRSRMGARARNFDVAGGRHQRSVRVRRCMERHRGSKPVVCSAIAETGGLACTNINRASFARAPSQRRLKRATTRPGENGNTDPNGRRCMSIPFVR
jgi:hypothetical protein